MRFLKLYSTDLLSGGKTDKYFDFRTYRVEFDGETVGFLSRTSEEVTVYVAAGTSLGLLFECMNDNQLLYLIYVDENSAMIVIGGKNEEYVNGTRLFFREWINI